MPDVPSIQTNPSPTHWVAPPLWPHQVEGIEFARDKKAVYIDGWMGVGKTRLAIEALRAWEAKVVLVFTPLRVVPAWVSQFQEHAGQGPWNVIALDRGPTTKRAEVIKRAIKTGAHVVFVMNYEAGWRGKLGKVIKDIMWGAVVFDEAQKIKAPGGKASRFCSQIMARHKLALSGTPMPHSPLDVYGQFRALDKTIFGTSFVRFRSQYAVMENIPGVSVPVVKGYRNIDQLRERMAQITFQIPSDVLDLEPARDVRLKVELSPKAQATYERMEKYLRAELAEGDVTAANGLVKLLRLQQITSGYLADDETGVVEEIDTGKGDLLQTLLEGLQQNEPVVVFCRFTRDIAIVQDVANSLDRTTCELSGQKAELEEWQTEGGPPVLAAQIQAGGVGIDLTRARYCVFFSLGFSLGDYLQARARVHRPGQKRHVTYYHLVAQGTIDERVYGALSKREDVVNATLAGLMEAR